ncbi:MAG: serine/threonine protein kinase [Desulfovibrionaceae bacterium]|nr:serine/threonine protein kinase [Desulfovibrionaceae bacterium]
MSDIIKLKAQDGSRVEFVNEIIGSGAQKDVYLSPDKSYVVAFFRKEIDAKGQDRLEHLTGVYRERIFNQIGGDYWKNLFCWPESLVYWQGKIGLVCPAYQKHFYFSEGPFKGKEKEGKWFASAKLRNRFLKPSQKGTWLSHFHFCIQMARAIRRLHAAGLAHSDLSYKNVLVDPEKGKATIIDIDGLVVPGKYPPEVVGTPDFIAPEVLETRALKLDDPQKVLPSINTDRHALAVLIYMYLFYRHPLRGGKVYDLDPGRDEELGMGSQALFIEHPTDLSNRPKIDQLSKDELPQGDVEKLPYTLSGPYLKELFDQAFILGLHHPDKRPTAAEWERALIKTTDLMRPCPNPECEAHWLVLDENKPGHCPFCGKMLEGSQPILDLYYAPTLNEYKSENYPLVVYDKQSLYKWHTNRFMVPNEKIRVEDRKPVGDFHFFQGKWILINRSLSDMYDQNRAKKIEPGQYVELTSGQKILFDSKEGGRMAIVRVLEN